MFLQRVGSNDNNHHISATMLAGELGVDPELFRADDFLDERFRLRRGYGVTRRIAGSAHC
jgi:hypothetical protein